MTATHNAAFRTPRLAARSPRGFTLIEIMVVIVIMGLIATLVAVSVTEQPDLARHKLAKANVKSIGNALEMYQLVAGRFPTTAEGLQELVTPTGAGHPVRGYLSEDDLTDPWGAAYHYVSPGDSGFFDLRTLGKDGVSGGDGVNADIEYR